MHTDHVKPVDQLLDVMHAKQLHHHGQASPVDATRAGGQQVPRANGLLVLRPGDRRFLALVLDAGLRVDEGR